MSLGEGDAVEDTATAGPYIQLTLTSGAEILIKKDDPRVKEMIDGGPWMSKLIISPEIGSACKLTPPGQTSPEAQGEDEKTNTTDPHTRLARINGVDLLIRKDDARVKDVQGEDAAAAVPVVIDPEYSRFIVIARLAAKESGYALAVHGSMTRDLDLIAVPWTKSCSTPADLVQKIEYRTGCKTNGHPVSAREHGRLGVVFLIGQSFEDPRYVDFSIVPPEQETPETPQMVQGIITQLKAVLDYAECNTCLHEETHRGGVLWEICDQCGTSWSDDEGGRPADSYDYPKVLKDAREFLGGLLDATPREERTAGPVQPYERVQFANGLEVTLKEDGRLRIIAVGQGLKGITVHTQTGNTCRIAPVGELITETEARHG